MKTNTKLMLAMYRHYPDRSVQIKRYANMKAYHGLKNIEFNVNFRIGMAKLKRGPILAAIK